MFWSNPPRKIRFRLRSAKLTSSKILAYGASHSYMNEVARLPLPAVKTFSNTPQKAVTLLTDMLCSPLWRSVGYPTLKTTNGCYQPRQMEYSTGQCLCSRDYRQWHRYRNHGVYFCPPDAGLADAVLTEGGRSICDRK